MGLFSVTRTERAVTLAGRDLDAARFVYARDAARQLFHVAGGDLADTWDDALRLYRLIGDEIFGSKQVGEALGITDRAGRTKIARLRLAGAIEDLGKSVSWADGFRNVAQRVIGGTRQT